MEAISRVYFRLATETDAAGEPLFKLSKKQRRLCHTSPVWGSPVRVSGAEMLAYLNRFFAPAQLVSGAVGEALLLMDEGIPITFVGLISQPRYLGIFADLFPAVSLAVKLPSFFGRQDALPVMVIPYLKDAANWRCEDKVRQTCLSAPNSFRRIYTADIHPAGLMPACLLSNNGQCPRSDFSGLSFDLFIDFIMNHYIVKTADGCQWLLDRYIAIRIWEICCKSDSPLPPANYQIELERKRAA